MKTSFAACAGSLLLTAMGLFVLPGCGTMEDLKERRALKAQQATWAAEHAAFRATDGWKKKTYRNDALLKTTTSENSRIEIAIAEQRGLLLVGESVAMDFPVATGKKSHPTPTGEFKVLGKSQIYASNLYGKIYDATGAVAIEDADTTRDAVPEGGKFVGAPMPYWMRLTNTGVGLHIGYVPGRPASHGCIRLPRPVAPVLFEKVKVGTPVVIAEKAPVLAPKKN